MANEVEYFSSALPQDFQRQYLSSIFDLLDTEAQKTLGGQIGRLMRRGMTRGSIAGAEAGRVGQQLIQSKTDLARQVAQQALQEQWQADQARLGREWQTGERLGSQDFSAEQALRNMLFQTGTRLGFGGAGAGEDPFLSRFSAFSGGLGTQPYESIERQKDRDLQVYLAELAQRQAKSARKGAGMQGLSTGLGSLLGTLVLPGIGTMLGGALGSIFEPKTSATDYGFNRTQAGSKYSGQYSNVGREMNQRYGGY